MPLPRADMATINAPAASHARSDLAGAAAGPVINKPATHAPVTSNCQTLTEGPATRGERNGSARSPVRMISMNFVEEAKTSRETVRGVICAL